MSGRAGAQRALHQVPGWDASIDDARRQLGYDVAWWNRADLAWDGSRDTRPPYFAFQTSANRAAVEAAGRAALDALSLPASFLRYWTACFHSYRDGAPATVETVGPDGPRRTYPPTTGVRWSIAGDVVTITAPVQLVTWEALRIAADRAWKEVQRRQTAHPYARARRAAGGVLGRQGRHDALKAEVVRLHLAGHSHAEIVVQLDHRREKDPTQPTAGPRTVQTLLHGAGYRGRAPKRT